MLVLVVMHVLMVLILMRMYDGAMAHLAQRRMYADRSITPLVVVVDEPMLASQIPPLVVVPIKVRIGGHRHPSHRRTPLLPILPLDSPMTI